MTSFSRDEVDAAFREFWRAGSVDEDWDAWADLFTEDAIYCAEHYGRVLQGREEIRAWIKRTMAAVPEMYTCYGWHMVEGDRVVAYMQNRRDNPDPAGEPIDFPGISVFRYAGGYRWSYGEDFWAVKAAGEARDRYAEACARFDPGHPKKQTRSSWPESPVWTRRP